MLDDVDVDVDVETGNLINFVSVFEVLSFPFTYFLFLLQISMNVSIFSRKFCATPAVSYMFLYIFAQEIGRAAAKNVPIYACPSLTAVLRRALRTIEPTS